MSSAIQRPVFFENQILGAADLTATVENSRGQVARHNRYLHLWGIASGLGLEKEPDKDKGDPVIKITLSPGLAIDGWGREIIVAQAVKLSENDFSNLQITNGAQPDDWFPVYLKGRDQNAAQPPLATSSCGTSSGTASRMEETYALTFGRPGDARTLATETAATVSDGPGSGGWRVLLGFVQWDKTKTAFVGLKFDDNGITRKFAGVQADELAARGGSVKLRTQILPQANKPALILDETEDGQIRFGSFDSKGQLIAVFTITSKGDIKIEGGITAKGKISGALAHGVTQVESGIATDGMVLPLPLGVTEKQVEDEEAVIQAQISLRFTGRMVPPGNSSTSQQWTASPLEAWVDTDRRVHCRVRWQQIGGTSVEDHPAACDYLVLASLKEKQA